MENGLKAEALPQWDAARVEAIDFTRATGREYGILMDPIAGIIGRVQGQKHQVDFEPLHSEASGRWIIHTHPSTMTLSPQDVLMANGDGVKGIVALGEDGSMYEASDLKVTSWDIMPLNVLTQALEAYLDVFVHQGKLHPKEARFLTMHEVHKLAKRRGLYDYRFKLGDRWREATEKLSRLTGKPLDGLASGV